MRQRLILCLFFVWIEVMSPVILWIILLVLTSLVAALVSSIRPLTQFEIQIQVFRMGSPISEWLTRVFISPWMHWDSLWYQKIVLQGYSAIDGTAQFHPLYPWLAAIIAKTGISTSWSLLLISSLAGIGLFYSYLKLAKTDFSNVDANFALAMLAFAPPAFILFAPYPEALFILLSVLCLYATRKKIWWLAGLMGGLASLTRQQGILLLIPCAWELWESASQSPGKVLKEWWNILSLCLIPVGMAVWLVYRAFFLNDLAIKITDFHSFIYSALISPSASKVVPSQEFVWPWKALYLAFIKITTKPDVDIWVNLVAALLFLVLLSFTWAKMRVSYRLYSLFITLVSFSYSTGSVHPYMGLPRHLFLAFPVFIGMAAVIKKTWLRLLLIAGSLVGMLFMLTLYTLEAWVP